MLSLYLRDGGEYILQLQFYMGKLDGSLQVDTLKNSSRSNSIDSIGFGFRHYMAQLKKKKNMHKPSE